MDPVSVIYVCLTTLGKKKCVTGWNFKSTKNAGFPISTTDCTYAFCTSGIFLYWRLKDTTKKNLRKKNLSGLVVWPDLDWSPSLISSWRRRKLAFDIRFSRRSLALFLSHFLFPHSSLFFHFCLFLLPSFLHFPKKQRVVESQIPDFFGFILK